MPLTGIDYEDRALTCVECNDSFLFESGEQRYFAERQYTDPRRCKSCRDAKKARLESGVPREREDHPATCSQCGAETTVPFKPSEGRPVYCAPCFRGNAA